MSPMLSSDREVRTWLAVLLGIFAAWCGHAVGGESAAPDALRAGLARVCITPAVQRELDAGLFPGAVVLVGRPGKVLYHDAFGFARIVPDKVKMAKDCIFDLASVTKPVATATAFGVCVDEKRLRFDMPIRQPLPELSGSGIEPITVTQLATHTSGFDNTKYHDRARARIGDAALASLGY
jgi:serine-type D-Ala-D-Ala carboxypeptidase